MQAPWKGGSGLFVTNLAGITQIGRRRFETTEILLTSLQVYSVNLRFTIVNSKSIYKYKHAYENGYDGYMVTLRYM